MFMLPWYVEHDINDVILELNRAGFPIRAEFFRPHIEFRFPFFGKVAYQGVEIELRQALEPWHVLGEEPVAYSASGLDTPPNRLRRRQRVKKTFL